MGVFLTKKSSGGVAITDRQQEALETVGLSPIKSKVVVKKKQVVFQLGQRVVVINNLFPWIEIYKCGDVGVVVRHIPIKSLAPGVDYDLYEIRLDRPRVGGYERVLVRRWELDSENSHDGQHIQA
jgi:hypothetical protein